ncbi:MAG: hypothetical protein FJ225_10580 [Lentisphaerae bacterium]|nr:hypothetical protein [Lentisphaerota bacterium]
MKKTTGFFPLAVLAALVLIGVAGARARNEASAVVPVAAPEEAAVAAPGGAAPAAPTLEETAAPAAERSEEILVPVEGGPEDVDAAVGGKMAGEEGRPGKELISIALDDVPLEDVVRMFTRITDANIIAVASNLEGSVTVNLTDVEWQPALRSILEMHNLSLVERTPGSGVYSVVPRPADAPEPMIVETVFLRYATVSDVAPVLRGMLVTNGMVSVFPSRNAMVIKTTERNLGEMKQIIAELDMPAKQVCIETKFMELNDMASEKLGLRWDSLDQFGAQIGLGPFTRKEDTTSTRDKQNTLRRWDRRQSVDTLDERYDMDNVEYEESTTTYVEGPPGTYVPQTVQTPARTVTDTIDTGEERESEIVNTFATAIAEQQAAILTLDSFNLVLSALKRMDGVTIVSNPKIIVESGSTNASFSVGEREPIIRKDIQRGTQDSPGDIVTAQLDTQINTDRIKQGYLATGIDLRVFPVVKTDDMIEADIRPSLKRKTGDKEVEGNTWPIISVKEIHTKFTLRSGQTVAIGGLTDTQDGKRSAKVPLLGDIPLVGKYIFSHLDDSVRQVETIIFVTLSLADPAGLRRDTGIPGDAELVHKQLLETEARKQKFQAQMEALREVGNAEKEDKADRAKSRLLRRRK